MRRILLALPLAAAAAALLAGCSSGLQGDDDAGSPSIYSARTPDTCADPGTTTIMLDPLSVLVTENSPIIPDTAIGAHYADVTGVISGLAAGATVYGLVLDDDLACPVTSSRVLPVTADGTFTARLRISTAGGVVVRNFRLLVVAGPAGATFGCPNDEDCLRMDVATIATPMSGISNAVGVAH